MKLKVYNQEGKEVKKIDVSDDIFNLELNNDLVHQVIVSQASNRRQGSAHTKDRGEVSGGGKKPWRQKGTGRARHGSIRSPLWKGGGVTFGPRNDKNYKKRIPKEMKRKALFMALSGKIKDNEFFVVDFFNVNDHKTKTMKEIVNCFPLLNKKTLIVLPETNQKVILGTRNLPEVQTMPAKNLTALDVLSFKNLIVLEDSVSLIEKTFLNN